ncbi:stage II sporulation protein R [uncultured Ruminococcus sp.]|uniref:stage II sporulation protein R n=1 Tax=uncultured Ruminococcus sp. TaxID=165186 RepID=UPI002639A808|nr:stage II sporulation protein R [uncultured Ruminococcus sp.]
MIVVEVMFLRKSSMAAAAAGLILAILVSNAGCIVRDGRRLDRLRGSVLRLHILADSDSREDQRLKLRVRDALLGSGIFSSADSLSEAEAIAEERLDDITDIAEEVLRENGCSDKVTAELADVDFGDRVYGGLTMPRGRYRALRIKIGRAEGHNWWCVMYPPLCLPAACGDSSVEASVTEDEEEAEEFFSDEELDMLKKPKKYRVRFAIWDKIKSIINE